MKNYEKPSMETIVFLTKDVITASVEDFGNPGTIFPGAKSLNGSWNNPDEGSDY